MEYIYFFPFIKFLLSVIYHFDFNSNSNEFYKNGHIWGKSESRDGIKR